jgi:hypothetical protein
MTISPSGDKVHNPGSAMKTGKPHAHQIIFYGKITGGYKTGPFLRGTHAKSRLRLKSMMLLLWAHHLKETLKWLLNYFVIMIWTARSRIALHGTAVVVPQG